MSQAGPQVQPERDGMKPCTRCGRTLPLERFYMRRLKSGRVAYESRCRECERQRANEIYLRRRTDPEWVERRRASRREANARYRTRHRDRHLEGNRRWRAAKKATAAGRDEINADQRMWHRLRRERELGVLDVRYYPAVSGGYRPLPSNGGRSGGLLPVGPIVEWLAGFHQAQGAAYAVGEWTVNQTAARLGVDEATVRRLLTGGFQQIGLGIADRIFVNAGHPELLAILYPLEEGQAAA